MGAHSQHVEMHAECDYNNDDNKLNSNNNNKSNAREHENPHSSSNVPPSPSALTPPSLLLTVAPQFGCVALVIIYSSIAMECLVVHHAAHGFSRHSRQRQQWQPLLLPWVA